MQKQHKQRQEGGDRPAESIKSLMVVSWTAEDLADRLQVLTDYLLAEREFSRGDAVLIVEAATDFVRRAITHNIDLDDELLEWVYEADLRVPFQRDFRRHVVV